MTDPTLSATTGLGDLLRQIALRQAPADRSPLLAMGEIAQPAVETVSLPLPPELAVAWRALIGEEAHPWQRQALHAAARGESLLLLAPPPLGVATLLLLATEPQAVEGQPPRATLLLATTASAFNDLVRTAASLDALLGGGLPHMVLDATTPVPRRPSPLIITTPTVLHNRVLRHHDRAWRWLWPALRRVILPGADEGPGSPLGHLRWLLRRIQRLRPSTEPLQILSSMRPVPDPQASAAQLIDRSPPTIVASDIAGVTTWAIWRSGADMVSEALALAAALRSSGLAVQLFGRDELERAILAQAGAASGLSVASWVRPPNQALIVPWSGEAELIATLSRTGYRLVVALADPTPATALPRHLPQLLAPEVAPPWPQASENPYIAAAHLRCAAEEQPLVGAEVMSWEALAVLERLERRGRLARLPEPEPRWQPAPGDDDPYEQLSFESVSGAPTPVFSQEGDLLDEVDPSLLERRLYPGAALPGASVRSWSNDGEVHLQAGGERWTAPLRRTQVSIREELGSRPLKGVRQPTLLRWGKVVVQEEITGRLEWQGPAAATTVPIDPILTVQWSAPACWLELGEAVASTPDSALLWASVVPAMIRCRPDDLVASVSNGSVFLVESQPGGRGLAEVLFERAELSLRLAHLAGLIAAPDARWQEPVSLGLRWLDSLYERPALAAPAAAPPATAPVVEQTRPLEDFRSRLARRAMPRARPGQARPIGTVVRPLPPREPERPPFLTRKQPGPAGSAAEQTPEPPSVPAKPGSEVLPVKQPVPPAPKALNRDVAPATRGELAAQAALPLPQEVSDASRSPEAPQRQQPENPRRSVPVEPREQRPATPERRGVEPRGVEPREPQRRGTPERRGVEPREPQRRGTPERRGVEPREPQRRGTPERRGVEPREQRPGTPERRGVEPREQRPGTPERRGVEPREQRPGTPERRGVEPREQRPGTPERRGVEPREQRQQEGRQKTPPPPREEAPPNAAALIERARRLREQREAALRQNTPAPRQQRPTADDAPAELRFSAGQRIICLPYGEGVILQSRWSDGRELLAVDFPAHGELQIDPGVSLVRVLNDGPSQSDDTGAD